MTTASVMKELSVYYLMTALLIKKKWNPNSITRLRWETNTKSMQEDAAGNLWFGSLVSISIRNCDVTLSILVPS